jgi:hypothetical protein
LEKRGISPYGETPAFLYQHIGEVFMKKKVLLSLVLLTMVTASLVFAQNQAKYYMEIWNISSTTFETGYSSYRSGNASGNTLEDAYYLVRTANGTTLRSKDKNLSIEDIRQKLLSLDLTDNDTGWANFLDSNFLPGLQQNGLKTQWFQNTLRYSGFSVFVWVRALSID